MSTTTAQDLDRWADDGGHPYDYLDAECEHCDGTGYDAHGHNRRAACRHCGGHGTTLIVELRRSETDR